MIQSDDNLSEVVHAFQEEAFHLSLVTLRHPDIQMNLITAF